MKRRIQFSWLIFTVEYIVVGALFPWCGCVSWSNSSLPPQCSKHEGESLLAFKEGIGDPLNILSSSWMNGCNCCEWAGVACDPITHRVVSLNISGGYLRGRVNMGLFGLKWLMHLDLSGNAFVGSIPDRIASLTSLTHLNMENCGFTGVIPPQIGNLSRLQMLDLSVFVQGRVLGTFGVFQGDKFSLKSGDLSWLKNLRELKYVSLSGVDLGMAGQRHEWGENIGSLYNLQRLDLSECNLSGTIPFSSLKNLTSLTHLNLAHNSFSSRIPSWLSLNHSNLVSLDLSDCNLQGTIPSNSLSNLSFLTALYLYGNQFTGGIPPSIGELSSLTRLDLSHNMLNGSIPISSIPRLSRLRYLDLSYNRLDGIFSLSLLQNLTHLSYLSLSDNQLTLHIDPKWSPPFQLGYLSMRNCNISDVIPPFISTQHGLAYLSLAYSNLRGTIPTWLWDLSLSVLPLAQNNLTGQFHLPNSTRSGVAYMDLQNNHLTASIPLDIGTIFPYLYFLSFASNSLTGSIPPSIGNMKYLGILDLSENKLYGKIPSSLGNCSALKALELEKNRTLTLSLQNTSLLQLKILDLGNNRISGHVPRWLGKLSELSIVILRSNSLEGHVPLELASLQALQILDLSRNNLSGPIPQNLAMLKAMINASQQLTSVLGNSVSYYYTEEIQVTSKAQLMDYTNTLSLVTAIDLSQNRLTGSIPPQLGHLNGLIILNISWNLLTGAIPDVFGTAMQLGSLDFSHNLLSGKIPPSLSLLGSLGFLDLAFNNLSGKIPQGRHLDTFESQSYVGNPQLCGRPLDKPCWTASVAPSTPFALVTDNENEDETANELLWYGGLLLSFAMGFCGVFGVLIYKREWKRKYDQVVDRLVILVMYRLGIW
eukprot:Gb_24443 [translate_table: standard]